MFYIFTSENITVSKYAFYFINNSLNFITLYIINIYFHGLLLAQLQAILCTFTRVFP